MNRPSLTVPVGTPPNHIKIATSDNIRLLIPIKDLREVYRSPRGKPRHYSKSSNRNSGPPTPSRIEQIRARFTEVQVVRSGQGKR
jgi:hypothetical protein